MLSKFMSNKKYVIIAIIGLITLWYILRPKSNFDSCYEKCMGAYSHVESIKRPAVCVYACANTK